MESQRFWIHLTLVFTVFMAVTVSQIVNSAGAGSEKSAGGTAVPPEGGFANPSPGASTGPTTGDSDDSKVTKGTVEERTKSEPGTSAHDRATPRKAPSSQPDKHHGADPVDPADKKGLGKESH